MKFFGFFFVLVSLTCGLKFQCEFKAAVWTSISGSHYNCLATIVNSGNLASLEEVTGNHLSGRSNFDVRSIHVEGDRTHNKIPRNLEKFFPNLLGLVWDDGNLTTISANDLKPFPYLRVLSIASNHVTKLDGDLFKYSPRLRYIRFHTNFFEHLGQDLLTDLNDLEWVDFTKNPCISMSASTTEQFEELNRQMPIKCPQLECFVTRSANKDFDEMMSKLAEQDEQIKELNGKVSAQAAKLAELEKNFIFSVTNYRN